MSRQDVRRKLVEAMLHGLPDLPELMAPEEPPPRGGNVVQLAPRANPAALIEFERRARQHFMEAILVAVDVTWAETKRLELGDVPLDVVTGIMHRVVDDVRLRFGWL